MQDKNQVSSSIFLWLCLYHLEVNYRTTGFSNALVSAQTCRTECISSLEEEPRNKRTPHASKPPLPFPGPAGKGLSSPSSAPAPTAIYGVPKGAGDLIHWSRSVKGVCSLLDKVTQISGILDPYKDVTWERHFSARNGLPKELPQWVRRSSSGYVGSLAARLSVAGHK